MFSRAANCTDSFGLKESVPLLAIPHERRQTSVVCFFGFGRKKAGRKFSRALVIS